jgi:TetR/AcrR family transcriptional repressor of nem operon
MNARVEQRERSHEAIVTSAARLLRAHGLAGTRVVDVMQGAGLTVGGFYAHFDSKEALLREALRRTSSEVRARLFGTLDEHPPEQRLDVALRRYLSAQHRDDHERSCPLPAVVGAVGTTARDYANVVTEQVDAMVSALAAELPSGASSSSSSSSSSSPSSSERLSRRTVAIAAVALMYGGLSLARAVAGTPLSDEILKACRAAGSTLR